MSNYPRSNYGFLEGGERPGILNEYDEDAFGLTEGLVPVFTFNPGTTGSILAGATTSVRATTATNVVQVGGIYTVVPGVLANVMRAMDHPSLGKGFWVESARTNEALFSTDISNAAWTKAQASSVATSVTAPDGNASTTVVLAEDGSAATTHHMSSILTPGAGSVTWSVFARAVNRDWIRISNDTVINGFAYFDVANGVAGVTGGGATDAFIEGPYEGDWYRVGVTVTAGAGAETYAINIAEDDNDIIFTGLTQDSVALWGMQTELGVSMSSPVPTTSSAVQRNADHLEYSATDVIVAEGSMVIEYTRPATADTLKAIASISNGTVGVAHRVFHLRTATNHAYQVENSGAQVAGQFLESAAGLTDGARHTYAVDWQLNSFHAWTDGILRMTDSSGTVPASLTVINVGSDAGDIFQMDGCIHSIKIFDRPGVSQ